MPRIEKGRLFVQVPYDDLLRHLWLILFFKVNTEIYISIEELDSYDDGDLCKVRTAFQRRKIAMTAHAPICDPYKDGFAVFKDSYSKTSEFCRKLGINSIVMHAEYEYKRFSSLEEWLRQSMETWRWISRSSERDDITVSLENHNELSPEPILKIITSEGCKNLKACFDVGHFNVVAPTDIFTFLDRYPPGSISEVHLSDNLGDKDAHLPLGKGAIDFSTFFCALRQRSINPRYTIEASDMRGIVDGFNYLRKIGEL